MDHKELFRTAMRAALDIREKLGLTPADPICVFNAAEQLGVSVRYIDIGSLEGMYCKSSATIILPTFRSPGRQAFACGHELGHWVFGHGSSIDQITELSTNSLNDPNDRIADAFSGYLLMPPRAVKECFGVRNWNPTECIAERYYTVSAQLGVSYEALIRHMQYSLNLIDSKGASSLLRYSPKEIRHMILGEEQQGNLIIADRHWRTVSIDLQVGDVALVPTDSILSRENIVSKTDRSDGLIQARSPGVARLVSEPDNWSAYVRVSKKGYVGQHTYRHMEDDDE